MIKFKPFSRLILLLVTTVAAFAVGYYLVVRQAAYQDLPLRVPPAVVVSSDYELELLRGNERTSETDTSRPFRNSVLTLRRLGTTRQNDSETTFLARGRSTGINRPELTDIASFYKEPVENAAINWGFQELAAGNYWVRPGTMQSKMAYEISGVGWTNERIFTSETQRIRAVPIIFNGESTPSLDIAGETSRKPTNVRIGCWIHGSVTKQWSHRDALGCITLQNSSAQSKREGASSEWNRFLTEMNKVGLADTTSPAVLLRIVDADLPLENVDGS